MRTPVGSGTHGTGSPARVHDGVSASSTAGSDGLPGHAARTDEHEASQPEAGVGTGRGEQPLGTAGDRHPSDPVRIHLAAGTEPPHGSREPLQWDLGDRHLAVDLFDPGHGKGSEPV
jgi:hypothetical protein